jgi:transposase
MPSQLVSDELWNEVEPLLPKYQPSPKGGRPPAENRTVFACILFVLKTGIAWEDLPLELGCSYKTCKRRLRAWTEAGVWQRLLMNLLTKLRAARRLDLADVLIDAGLIKAPLGGQKSVRIPRIAAVVAAN